MLFCYMSSQTEYCINLLRRGITQDMMYLFLASLYLNSSHQSSS